MGLDPADNESHIDICDLLMLAICLEDQQDGSGPAEFWSALQRVGHEHALSNEFLQMVKGDALHVECSYYGTKMNVPQVESVLTLESLPQDGAVSSSIRRILSKLSTAI